MSRGFGRTQRLVLAELARARDEEPGGSGWEWVYNIAHTLACGRAGVDRMSRAGADVAPTASDLQTVRRAVRTLASAGVIEIGYAGPRRQSLARLPP